MDVVFVVSCVVLFVFFFWVLGWNPRIFLPLTILNNSAFAPSMIVVLYGMVSLAKINKMNYNNSNNIKNSGEEETFLADLSSKSHSNYLKNE